jgi:murein L,D-transpeptidase YcbB/YkuD
MQYNYVQSSGNSNSLGRVKIIFPNDFSVYLHDTPSKSLFNKIYRARSSGCVRVQKVFSLASEILNRPEKEIIGYVDSNKTKRFYVDKLINVHFLYWTVTFNNETPVFLNDVYNFDDELAQKLTY